MFVKRYHARKRHDRPYPTLALWFDNYHRVFTLLREAIWQESPLTQLEKVGVIQRFEYTMELVWKTLKDYLESEMWFWTRSRPAR